MVNKLAEAEAAVSAVLVDILGREPTHFEVVRGYNYALRASRLNNEEVEDIMAKAGKRTFDVMKENDSEEII